MNQTVKNLERIRDLLDKSLSKLEPHFKESSAIDSAGDDVAAAAAALDQLIIELDGSDPDDWVLPHDIEDYYNNDDPEDSDRS